MLYLERCGLRVFYFGKSIFIQCIPLQPHEHAHAELAFQIRYICMNQDPSNNIGCVTLLASARCTNTANAVALEPDNTLAHYTYGEETLPTFIVEC
ncbi:hypothetical protein C8J56DRAFT_1167190, partial [Mycena floridula]